MTGDNSPVRLLPQPRLGYARRAAKIYCQWLFKTYPQPDALPLLKNFADFEALFEASEVNFESVVTPYVSEHKWFLGRIYNQAFESIDLELYYSMVRHYKPNLIIEIGSGHSTHFAMDALKRNQRGRIISIDPEPRRSLPDSVEHIQSKVEDVNTDIFAALEKNDILFIDSSHTTEETKYHCQYILPSIKEGVIVHHHDFAFPYRYYVCDDPVTFGEPEVLLEFYQANQKSYEVVTGAAYVRFRNPQLVKRLVKSYRWSPHRIPGSLWVRKTS